MTTNAAVNQGYFGPAVTTRNYSWSEMVRAAWGTEWNAPDHGVYEFSNGGKRDSTDRTSNGFYNGGNANA